MAVRIVGWIDQMYNDDNADLFGVQVLCKIIGSDFGDFSGAMYHYTVYGLDPDSVTLNVDIQAAVKTNALTHSIPFGALNVDTVKLL